jgi:hypothetical protein
VEAVADQVADTDAMLRGAARHTVVDFTAANGPVTHAADGTGTGAADGTVTGGAAEQAPASHTG